VINEKFIQATNFIRSTYEYLLIILDTLLLRTSLHFTQLHFTPLHYTCWHFTQLHFTTLSFGLTPFKFPTSLIHLTLLHFTSLHCSFRCISPHFYSFRFIPFIIAVLNLCLKILGLKGKVSNFSAGRWFQFQMVLFTKGILTDILSLLPVPNFPNMINPT